MYLDTVSGITLLSLRRNQSHHSSIQLFELLLMRLLIQYVILARRPTLVVGEQRVTCCIAVLTPLRAIFFVSRYRNTETALR